MSKMFLHIYNWFENHVRAFYILLIVITGICALMASQVSFQEDITNFLDDSGENKNVIFNNIKSKDKIIVMLTGDDPDCIIESAEIFESKLDSLKESRLINSVIAYADDDLIGKCTSFVYEYLPIFLTDDDYARIDEQLSREGMEKAVNRVYELLTSPSGMIVGDVVMRDPLNIGTPLMKKFEKFNTNVQYEIYNGRLFTHDLSTMFMFIEPSNGMGDTGHNDRLVTLLEAAELQAEIHGVEIDCVGGPIVAVYNARQIKDDTTITMGLAMIFILAVIFFSFRNRWSIPLIVIPPVFGALFALAMVWLVQGGISTIAIGAGTVVLGISLSYSIHIVSHINHRATPQEVIEELTIPLTIGCFTTIGAFAALMFTSSALLQDMGLFSVFALIGTTLFCLIFLPHFLNRFDTSKKSMLLDKIERVVGYSYDGNKWVVFPILFLSIAALFFYQDVKFDDDISNINYMPEHIEQAEEAVTRIMGSASREVYLVTANKDDEKLFEEYTRLDSLLRIQEQEGNIEHVVDIGDFAIPVDKQIQRIHKWEHFWQKHANRVIPLLEQAAQDNGFRKDAFKQFEELLLRTYEPCKYTEEEIGQIPVISEWINSSDDSKSLLSRITIDDDQKSTVYEEINRLPNTAVIDRGYFSSKMVEATSNDFNYILFVSSLIVFVALWLSYGRIELTLLTFLPMCVSWVIILGFMAVCDIKFNIVNIILATFIFGIGDDFSIFIMDGLLQEYKNGKKVLDAHKSAIFFSAFTAMVGMGVLIFAQHPALKSIALISVLGLAVVVFVSYTIQPMLFRLLVTAQVCRGGVPYTLVGILNTLYCFIYFLLGCIFLHFYMLILMVLPIKRILKRKTFHKAIYYTVNIFLHSMIMDKVIKKNLYGETFDMPAVIIANHQSFIDILLLLSMSPKIIMVTNSWVWHSPFFGLIVRYADFYHSADGYEVLAKNLKERINEGYSVVIFPEGTRSTDCSIQRFHKGAFYLAQLLKLDILPMLIYGAGYISSKRQSFYIKPGIVGIKILKRRSYGDSSMGETYQDQAKNYREWYIEQYAVANDELGRAYNPYFRDMLIKNYIYKGPILERYMRVKCHLDGYYDLWDRLLPRNAVITDIGCGYGQMAFMMGLLSPWRQIVAIDYDPEKISLASNSFLAKRMNIRWVCADMRTVDIPCSDAILFNDSLHYVNQQAQEHILAKAVLSLREKGIIIVRDGDASQTRFHDKIKRTEVWSTRILKFNKISEPLCFVDAEWMKEFAESKGMDIKVKRCDRDSSETLYILSKKLS